MARDSKRRGIPGDEQFEYEDQGGDHDWEHAD